MIRIVFTTLIIGLFLVFTSSCTNERKTSAPASGAAHDDAEGFYTCPMHPQIHEHKAGACPICGMALVKVDQKKDSEVAAKFENEGAKEFSVSQTGLSLAGIGRYTVESKDLIFSIPISGRFVSEREIGFQVYELDLQLVKSGLEFVGSSATDPDKIFTGRIQKVDNLIDPSSRTVRVLGMLNGSIERVVIDGAFHGVLKSVAKAQLAVPEDAVLHTGLRDIVYMITKENLLKPVAVKLGRKSSGQYQVLSGLKVGDVISTGPNFLIDSEAKIRGIND